MSSLDEIRDEIFRKFEEIAVRERLFREDFTHAIKRELVDLIDQTIARKIRSEVPLFLHNNSRLFMHTLDGHRLLLDAREKFMALHLLEHGSWEDHIRFAIRALLPAGGTFIDVGANIGVHTLYASTVIGPNGKILAFEPSPATREICRENLEINGLLDQVVLSDFALSEKDGELVDFEHFDQHPAMSGFKIPEERLTKFAGSKNRIRVKTTTIDSIVAALSSPPDLIKIDVEGFELQVLKGSQSTIENCGNVSYIVEYEKALATSVLGFDPINTIFEFFSKNGFNAYSIESNCSFRIIDLANIEAETGVDYLFTKIDVPTAELSSN